MQHVVRIPLPFSANPAHGLQIAYDQAGVTTLTSRAKTMADWRVSFQLQGVGYHHLTPFAQPPALVAAPLATGSRLTYRWSDNVTEWWLNSADGLEQWFELAQPPAGRTAALPLRAVVAAIQPPPQMV